MKKILRVTLAAMLALGLLGCGTPAATEATTSAPAAEPTAEPIVVFADPLLEAMVRAAMGRPEGDITLAEAEAVKELKLGIDWQQEPVPGTQIKDISGLENFKNLENLELQFHAITDISPLAGLTKLTSLALGGNPIADVSPLAGLTSLGSLTLFNCQAQDYTPLANLTGLGMLLMEYSTISDVSMLSGLTELWWLGLANTQVSDVSPLSTLSNLRKLQLAGCPISDYTPLAAIYPNLEEADFSIVSSLRELGFATNDSAPEVEGYKAEEMYILVNRAEWGERENKDEENAVLLCKNPGTENEITVIYYPDEKKSLVFSHPKDFRYTFDHKNDEMNVEYGEERANAFMAEAYDEVDPYLLLTPIKDFDRVMTDTFGVSANTLYTLPREIQAVDASSLLGLGFTAHQEIASYLYEQHEPSYCNVEIHNPAWGDWEEGGDVRFFTPLSEQTRIVVTYFAKERKFLVKADDNDGSGAAFEFFVDRKEAVDGWCGNKDMTASEYFINAYNDPKIEDVHLHSVELMIQYIDNTFGLTVDELYALPTGE